MKALQKILMILAAPCAHGAVMTLDGLTADTATSGARTITSATVGTTVYTSFEQPTSTNISGETVWRQTNEPANDAASILDQFLDTGALNSGTFQVQYGRTVAAAETFMWIDGDLSRIDGVNFKPINSSGSVVGDYLLTVNDIAYNTDTNLPNLTIGTVNRQTGGVVANWEVAGITFSISDFMGTTGDLSTVTGLQIEDNANLSGTLDTQMMAIATIPEPSAALLGTLGCIILLRRRK